MAQVVVEVVAVQRPDDPIRNAGGIEPIGQRRRGLPSRVPRIGEDGHPRDAVRPLPPSQPVGRQRRPRRHSEYRLRRQRRLDALGNAQVAVLRQRRQPHRAAGHGIQHLLPRRRLGRAVLEQEGAMDAAGRHARAVAHDRDHAGPAAFGVVVGQVGVKQQIGRSGIPEPAALQVDLGSGASERLASIENAGDFTAMVALWRRQGRRWTCRRWMCRQRPVEMRQPGRLLEQGAVCHARRVMDQVDRAGGLAGRMIVAPAGAGPAQMNDAGSLLARRTAGEIGAPQRLAIRREPRLGEQPRQPVGGRRHQLFAHRGEIETYWRLPDVVEVDHGRALRQGSPARARRA